MSSSGTGATFPFLIYTFCHVGLLVRLIFVLREKHKQAEKDYIGLRCPILFDYFGSSVMLLILVIGLILDNLRLFVGEFLDFGLPLQVLTYPSFFLHNVVVPWVFIIGSYFVHEPISFLRYTWIKDWHILRFISWMLGCLFSILGLINFISHDIPNLYETTDYNVVKYTVDAHAAALIPLIILSLYLTTIGFCIWKRFLWPWLFLLQLLALIGQSIPNSAYRTFASNFWEVIFAYSLVLTQSRVLDLQKMALGKKLLESDPAMVSLE